MNETYDISDMLALDLEYRLTIAYRIGCECASYFVKRHDILIPEMLKQAKKKGIDPIDVFAKYAHAVHTRHADQLKTLAPVD